MSNKCFDCEGKIREDASFIFGYCPACWAKHAARMEREAAFGTLNWVIASAILVGITVATGLILMSIYS